MSAVFLSKVWQVRWGKQADQGETDSGKASISQIGDLVIYVNLDWQPVEHIEKGSSMVCFV